MLTRHRTWDVIFANALGVTKNPIFNLLRLEATLALNKPASLTVDLPSRFCTVSNIGTGFAVSDFTVDDRVILLADHGDFRIPRTQLGETEFFVESAKSIQEADGRRIVRVTAKSAVGLLGRRINPHDAENNASDRNPLPCDDALRRTIRDNLSTIASSHAFAPGYGPDPIRTYLADNGFFTVQADASVCTSQWEGQIENANVLDVCQRIADYAAGQDEFLFFDVVSTGAVGVFGPLQFRVFTGQRGTDRTMTTGAVANIRMIGPDLGNVNDYEVGFDASSYVNRVYVGGSGTGAGRPYATRDETGLAASLVTNPWLLRETFTSEESSDINKLATVGDGVLFRNRIATQASGSIVEGDNFRFGIDWNFGDRMTFVTEELGGDSVDVFIDSLVITLEDEAESVAATFSQDSVRAPSGLGLIVNQIGNVTRAVNSLGARG